MIQSPSACVHQCTSSPLSHDHLSQTHKPLCKHLPFSHTNIYNHDTQQERVRQMTEELDSYCRSESFRIEFRRPDGNGWLTPAEAEAKGLCS